MASFATPAELASWLQVASVDTASAQLQLNVATRAIINHCGWGILEATVTADPRDARGGRSLFLPTRHLTAVTDVVADGVALVAGTDYEWWGYGELERLGRCWPHKPRSVLVTYTHGYTPVPDDVKGACLSIAGRLYQNPSAAKAYTKTAGPFAESQTYSDALPPLSNNEVVLLSAYKRERFA